VSLYYKYNNSGVCPSTSTDDDDDDDVPGFVGRNVLGLGSGGGEFGGGRTLGFIIMTHQCRLPLWWTAKGCVADSKLIIGLMGGVVAMV